jgi:hypothetical protein
MLGLFTILLLGSVSVANAYTVQSGDTMWKIAREAKMSLSELISLNPQVTNPNVIKPGDHLSTGEMYLPEVLGAVTSPIAGVTYSLAGSGITASASSITLASLTIPQTGYELLDADFSDTFYITLEPGNTKRQEIASCTTVTQNANNSATLSGCSRGLTPFTPFTASTSYAFSHGGGTTVIFSDPPQLFNEFTAKGNQEVISAPWRFDQYPTASTTLGNATTSRQFITLGQANLIGNQGAATSTETNAGIAELATQAEMAASTDLGANDPLVLQAKYATSTCQIAGLYTVITSSDGKITNTCLDLTENYTWTGNHTMRGASFSSSTIANGIPISTVSTTIDGLWDEAGNVKKFIYGESIAIYQLVSVSSTNSKVYLADASVTSSANNFIGYALESGTSGQEKKVQVAGVVRNLSGLTTSTEYYVDRTAGSVTSSISSAYKSLFTTVRVGKALSATEMLISVPRGRRWQFSNNYATNSSGTLVLPVGFKANQIHVFAARQKGSADASTSNGFALRNGVQQSVTVSCVDSAAAVNIAATDTYVAQLYSLDGSTNCDQTSTLLITSWGETTVTMDYVVPNNSGGSFYIFVTAEE